MSQHSWADNCGAPCFGWSPSQGLRRCGPEELALAWPAGASNLDPEDASWRSERRTGQLLHVREGARAGEVAGTVDQAALWWCWWSFARKSVACFSTVTQHHCSLLALDFYRSSTPDLPHLRQPLQV
ncbi:Hypothetical protein Deide_1p01282 (plasmid) [Deinococcus deserti VCD115]|uniref:Uncharacterized protein n=1 Tax=Deinococcus deserti (strain DSM 17065 / CIP 109153 / LMG 22923 / VCD115) TaxID=546414 RepID=C1D2C9_DEIDV|nr:Hypothetical protein Deide_1p01282 [Deinococcus deserti VCD115]